MQMSCFHICQGSYKNNRGNINLILLWAGIYTCVGINDESATWTLAYPRGLMDSHTVFFILCAKMICLCVLDMQAKKPARTVISD
jgi:hypothetical protein